MGIRQSLIEASGRVLAETAVAETAKWVLVISAPLAAPALYYLHDKWFIGPALMGAGTASALIYAATQLADHRSLEKQRAEVAQTGYNMTARMDAKVSAKITVERTTKPGPAAPTDFAVKSQFEVTFSNLRVQNAVEPIPANPSAGGRRRSMTLVGRRPQSRVHG